MRRFLLISAAALALAGATPALARQPAPSPEAPVARLTAADRAAVLDAVREKVKTLYVFPEKRAAILARLNAGQKAGRYTTESPAAFNDAVTRDLADASGDSHMYMLYDPARAAAAATAPAEADEAYWRARALRENHGLGEMKILPGNVRYLKVNVFLWAADQSGQAYDDAMRFLKGGDALIIDLRGNGGGNAFAVNYLVSHFMKPDTLLLTFMRGSETPAQSRTLATLSAGRMADKPLYVLTDRGCFSACEEFAYHVQQFKLGELIGAKTGGGANNNEFLPVGAGFLLSISVGRPVHAVSGTNWEGVGIAPDIESAPPQALDIAQQRALTRLAASPTATPEARADHAWALPAAAAKVRPPEIPAERLQVMAGRYGEVQIAFRDGELWYKRADRPERRLAPLDDKGLFAVDGATMIRVRIVGDRLELVSRNGPPLPFKRS